MSSNQQALLMVDDDGGGTPPPGPPSCVADPYYSCGPTNDPYWANVVLMLHFDGVDGSTTFTDSSQNPKTVTRTGSFAAISTDDFKFGAASVYPSAAADTSTGDGLILPNSADFDFNTGNFTIECWGKPLTPVTFTKRLFFYSRAGNAGLELQLLSNGSLALGISTSAGTASASSSVGVVGFDIWNHLAVVRSGDTFLVFANGQQAISVARTGSLTQDPLQNFVLLRGYAGSPPLDTGHWFGYVDDFRITKGVARYTGNFNIPTAAFPDSLEVNKDPYLDSVVLHLRGDGVDGGTTFTDISSQGLVPTVVGGITTATDAQAFAGTSIKSVTGGSSYLQYDFLFADTNEDFTFEFFYRILSQENIGGGYTDGRGTIVRLLNDSVKVCEAAGMIASASTQLLAIPGAYSPAIINYGAVDGYDRFYCVFARKGGYIFAMLNGRLATALSSGSTAKVNEIRIGNAALDAGRETSAVIEEVRFTKGVCRYMPQSSVTAVHSFRVPLEPHPAEEGISWIPDTPRTVLSLHAESESIEDTFNAPLTSGPQDIVVPQAVATVLDATAVTYGVDGATFVLDNTSNYIGYAAGKLTPASTTPPLNRFVLGGFFTFLGTPSGTGDVVRFFMCGPGVSEFGFALRVVSNVLKLYARNWVSGNTFLLDPVIGQEYELVLEHYDGTWRWYVDGVELFSYVSAATSGATCQVGPYNGVNAGVTSLKARDINITTVRVFDVSCYQPKTVTLTNLAEVSTVEKKFNTASFLVPNAGTSTTNGVVVNDHMDLDFGTGDFTIEMWAYRSANTYAGTLFYFTESAAFSLVVAATTGLVTLNYRSSGGTQANIATGVTFPLTTWQHVVVQRRGTNFEFYLHGVLGNTTAITGGASSTVNSAGAFYLGRTNTSSALSWNGYIDEARITKGVARYVNPNLPTAVFPDSAPEDPYWANVVLMLHCDGANGGTTFTDSSSYARTPATAQSINTVTADPKFGTASLERTAANALLDYASSTDFAFQQVFTLEFWIKPVVSGAVSYLLANSGSKYLVINAAGTTISQIGWGIFPNASVTPGVWQHVALCRDATTARTYVNGIPTGTESANTTTSATAVQFGIVNVPTRSDLNAFTGQLDEIRYTQGICRYPLSFDPATLPNCDSTTAGETRTINGTSPLTGASVTVQQQPIGSQDAYAYLTNNFIDLGPPLVFRVNRIDTYAGAITASSFNIDRTEALTGVSATVSSGSLTVPPYPNLRTTSTSTITILPTAGTASLTAQFFTDGTFVARDQDNIVRINETWIDTAQTNYDISDISSLYRVVSVNVFSGPILKYTYTAPPLTLSSAFSVVISNSDPGAVNAFDFQVTIGPATNNPRYGEAFYYGTHRVKANLG